MPIKNRTTEVIDEFLIGVLLATVVPVMVIAPNGLIALEKPLMKFLEGRDKKHEARRIAKYIKKQKLVEVYKNSDGSFRIRLTENGKTIARRVHFEKLEVTNKVWDQKWKILMFDIAEEYKSTRDYISRHLKRIGFKQLQRSVFVYPYPVDEFVELVRELFPEVAKNIIYLTTNNIDTHNRLIYQFQRILR